MRTATDFRELLPATLTATTPLRVLLDLYATDREAFFELAQVPVSALSDEGPREVALLAHQVRQAIREGFQIIPDGTAAGTIRARSVSIQFYGVEVDQVENFFNKLNGTTSERLPRSGQIVTETELNYKLGSKDEWEDLLSRTSARQNSRPAVLRVRPADIEALRAGMPAYVVHGLLRSAVKTVQAPTAVYEGLRKADRFKAARAFVGKPRYAIDNSGDRIPAPQGKLYAVFVDSEGYVFDWDWIDEDPETLGKPVDAGERFGREIDATEAVISDLPEIAISSFNAKRAWYSSGGDCIFWYFADTFSYAQWVNDDLTVFRAEESGLVTGFKLKNIEAIVGTLTKLVAKRVVSADQGESAIKAVLAASFLRQYKAGQPTDNYGELMYTTEREKPLLVNRIAA